MPGRKKTSRPGRTVRKTSPRDARQARTQSVSGKRDSASFLNLKGEHSSYALLRCMLVLEEMAAGEGLEVLLDDPAASTDLPRFLEEEGHRIVGIERVGRNVWRIEVEKRDR